MSILMSLLSNNGYIIVNKDLIKKLGLHEAILLGEMCAEYTYWEKSNKLEEGFFFSTKENIAENTGLSPYQQRLPLKRLVEYGIVIEKNKGIYNKKWYSFNMDKLYKLLNEEIELKSTSEETLQVDVKKLDNQLSRNFTSTYQENEEQDIKKLDTNNNKINNKKSNNKKKYNERVYMTEEEYKAITDKYGYERTNDMIEELSLYKKSVGKRYADDYVLMIK